MSGCSDDDFVVLNNGVSVFVRAKNINIVEIHGDVCDVDGIQCTLTPSLTQYINDHLYRGIGISKTTEEADAEVQ